MGYDLHITRTDLSVDPSPDPITESEWRSVVEADPDLDFDASSPHGFVIWRGPSRHAEPWFQLVTSYVYSKNPDPPVIQKMLDLAARLNAFVQGDDGEVYREAGRVDFPDGLLGLDRSILYCDEWCRNYK
ncbi:MAG: hypothetical protein AAF800_10925 [Planctomycetota bacterium]